MQDHHGDDLPHSPRAILKRQCERLQEHATCRPSAPRNSSSTFSRKLTTVCPRKALGRICGPPIHSSRTTTSSPPRKEEALLRAMRNGLHGAGIPVENYQGRVGPRPGRTQRALRRRAHDGRPPRDHEEGHQGDRHAGRPRRDLHGEVALRPRRFVLSHPCVALGSRRVASRCSTTRKPNSA